MKMRILIPVVLILFVAISQRSFAQKSESVPDEEKTSAPEEDQAAQNESPLEEGLRRISGGGGEIDLDIDIHIDGDVIRNSIRVATKELEELEVNLESLEAELSRIEIDIPEINIEMEPIDVEVPDFEFETGEIDINVPEIDYDFEDFGDDTSEEWRNDSDEGSSYEPENEDGSEKVKDKNKSKDKEKNKDKTKGLKKL